MGDNRRYDPECRRERADIILREQLKDTLLTALRTGADAAYAVQRAVGYDLARLRILHPEVRFISSTGRPAG